MATSSTTYRAGAASIRITPDEALWLAGYAARREPSRGTISDLYASALALQDDQGNRFVIASADLIGFTPIIADAIVAAARERHGLLSEQLLLAATHTHYGPEFRPDKAPFFEIPHDYAAKLPRVAATLADKVARAIDDALARLEPARLFIRTISADFAHNRRRHGVKNGIPSAEDVVDHDVPVLECVSHAGRRIAVVFGYACHNTTIPPDDRRYCADWAGFAKERLESMNLGAVAMFLAGAGADQDPEPNGAVEIALQHGRTLADAVQAALSTSGVEITGPIRGAITNLPLALEPMNHDKIKTMLNADDPPQRNKAQFLLDALARGETLITSYDVPLQVVRFGRELLLIALSGEPVIDWSHKLKHLTSNAGASVWVAGYCNDMFGYLPTRRVQTEGGYEGGRANLWSWIPAPFTGDVEERVTTALQELLERVSPTRKR